MVWLELETFNGVYIGYYDCFGINMLLLTFCWNILVIVFDSNYIHLVILSNKTCLYSKSKKKSWRQEGNDIQIQRDYYNVDVWRRQQWYYECCIGNLMCYGNILRFVKLIYSHPTIIFDDTFLSRSKPAKKKRKKEKKRILV